MKSIFTTITFSVVMAFCLGSTAFAVPPVSETTANTKLSSLSLEDLKTITPKQYNELTGKKLSIAQIIGLKFGQRKLKKLGKEEMSGKTVGIIAHITLIGWIIAFIKNSDNKTELGSFYLRQMLGIMLAGLVLSIIAVVPIIGWIVAALGWIFVLILFIISLIGAFSGEKKLVPIFGKKFQEWFKDLI